ncbi:MAG: twin-arginine translocase TatA/TatE family subunit [Methylacidiphilales bacterium]|nr:twin-arginine translocase TatA/TatE family subunit [Candidatus Methylacidiphilales bacterium]
MQHPFFAWLPHGTDFVWIFLLAVLLFGANKLPQLARGLGKSLGEFKKAKEEFEKEVRAAATTETETKPATGSLPSPATPTLEKTPSSADELTKKS